MRFGVVLVLALLLVPDASSYEDEIRAFRSRREVQIAGEAGWLTLTGLAWLREGDNTVGSDPTSVVVLPAPAPTRVGTITRTGRATRFSPAPGVSVRADGVPLTRPIALESDKTKLEVGPITFNVIERGERLGVRVRNRDAAARRTFAGLRWYPIDPRMRIRARFEAWPEPKSFPVQNVLGDMAQMESPGRLHFAVDGRDVSLDAFFEDEERSELFIIFKDRTNGDTTYGAGRYLYVPVPADGVVDLDFNRAYNPPCAFTTFATCPLPPRPNWLPIRIEAGERAPLNGH